MLFSSLYVAIQTDILGLAVIVQLYQLINTTEALFDILTFMLQTYRARLSEKQELATKIYRFVFTLEAPQQVNFTAGQYLLLEVKGGYRQYSISSPPSQKTALETIVDVTPMGIGSKHLLSLNIGDTVSFRAPLGMFFLQTTNKPKLFLATGTGIAPIKAMILTLVEKGFSGPFQLFWGLRNKQDIYFQDLWASLKQKNSNFDYTYCLSREKDRLEKIFPGHIQDALKNFRFLNSNFQLHDAEFYLCGRPQTVDALKQFLLEELNISTKQVFHEKFT